MNQSLASKPLLALSPQWSLRHTPLKACALWVASYLIPCLLRRLQQIPLQHRHSLTLQDTRQGLLITGDASQLPWLEGAIWLGCDAAAPELLLPTLYETNLPALLLQQACLKRTGCQTAVIVMPKNAQITGAERLQAADNCHSAQAYATLLVPIHHWQPVSLWMSLNLTMTEKRHHDE